VAPEAGAEETLEQKIERRADHLTGYQSRRLARRYRRLVERAGDAEQALGVTDFAEAVAEGYFKLLSYKDEYEVARLHTETLDKALAEAFGHVGRVTYHLAPPILGRKDSEGRPVKTEFGPWMARAFRILARFKVLRGTPLDPFARSAERRMERRMIRDYEALIGEILGKLDAANAGVATELARLPLQVRGFGHVKLANAERVAALRDELLAAFRSSDSAPAAHAAE
jgi:indolepyruvate ferredoxin oxidoreductase